MAYIRIRDVPGKVCVPEDSGAKKHKCKDCFFCQMCSDERCESCRKQRAANTGSGRCKKVKQSRKVGK